MFSSEQTRPTILSKATKQRHLNVSVITLFCLCMRIVDRPSMLGVRLGVFLGNTSIWVQQVQWPIELSSLMSSYSMVGMRDQIVQWGAQSSVVLRVPTLAYLRRMFKVNIYLGYLRSVPFQINLCQEEKLPTYSFRCSFDLAPATWCAAQISISESWSLCARLIADSGCVWYQ